MNAADKPAKTPANAKPRRRLLRAAAWVLLALVIVAGGILLWTFNTESGARFVLARAQSALGGKLVVGHASGTLSGPLVLDDVRYADAVAGIDARIKHVSVDPDILALLGGRVELSDVVADDVDVTLTTIAPKPENASGDFSLTAPIDIFFNKLALQRAKITRDGEPIFVVDRLDLIGAWTHDGLLVKQLGLQSPDGRIDLTGSLGTVGGYSGSGETTFSWRAGDIDLEGVLKSRSDGKQAHIDLTLTKPTPATATITIDQNTAAAWSLELDVPSFEAKKILADSALGQLALHLQGSGDRVKGEVHAAAEIDQHKVSIEPLRYVLNDNVVTIESMHLTSPESPGALDMTGTIDTVVSPLAANLKANWKGIVLPADLVGQPLATHGELAIDGSVDQFAAKGSLFLGPPDALANIDVDITGTLEAITLNTVRLKQAKGGLDASGTISLQRPGRVRCRLAGSH